MLTDHISTGDHLAIYRTAGGLYMWNAKRGLGGKTTSLRRGPGVPPQILRVAVLESAALFGAQFEPVEDPESVLPGASVLIRRVIGDGEFRRTSIVVETHHGQLVSELTSGQPHLVFTTHSAFWLPSGDPTEAVQMLDDGSDVEPAPLPDLCVGRHLILRVDSSVMPEDSADTLHHGHEPAAVIQAFAGVLAELQAEYPGIRLRQTVYMPRDAFMMLAGIPADLRGQRKVLRRLASAQNATYTVCGCGRLMPCREHHPEG